MTDAQIEKRGLDLFDRFAMPNTAHRRLGEYSKGMRQKVGIIRAMLHNPAVLLLDEPTSAMDPHSAKLVRDAITELKSDNRAIVVCTHNLVEAESLAERIAIINRGQIVAEGNPAALKRQLLGRPQLEVQVDRPLNGHMKELEDLITIEWVAGDIIRFRTGNPVATNPLLVSRLAGLGLGIISLREISQSLEDVYLHVVSGERS
jgi:ABC-2 type transport system ATP-binding protein